MEFLKNSQNCHIQLTQFSYNNLRNTIAGEFFMADTENTNSGDAPVLVPVIAGTAVGVAGATAISHLMNREESVARGLDKANEKLDGLRGDRDARLAKAEA